MKYEDLDTLLAALHALASAEEYINQHDWSEEYFNEIMMSLLYINDAKATLADVIKGDGLEKSMSAKNLLESK